MNEEEGDTGFGVGRHLCEGEDILGGGSLFACDCGMTASVDCHVWGRFGREGEAVQHARKEGRSRSFEVCEDCESLCTERWHAGGDGGGLGVSCVPY